MQLISIFRNESGGALPASGEEPWRREPWKAVCVLLGVGEPRFAHRCVRRFTCSGKQIQRPQGWSCPLRAEQGRGGAWPSVAGRGSRDPRRQSRSRGGG